MSRSNEQWAFWQDVMRLSAYAREMGYKLTPGEVKRTPEQQATYMAQGKSKTMDSMHLIGQAIDFNIFFDVDDDGDKDYINTAEEYEAIGTELGDYWVALNPEKNRCGFQWGWDQGHFERRS